MAFQPEEVSSIIQQQLEKHDAKLEMDRTTLWRWMKRLGVVATPVPQASGRAG